jgi:predicted O-linked N-acetylglucosamine transferase (SPINDLY family)
VVYLPDSYQVNDSRRATGADVPSRHACGLPETGFVFCNFNQGYKLTPSTFASWMKIVGQVEGSVLWLLKGNKDFARRLRQEAANHGVAPERLVFAPVLPLEQHLARHRNADLFLDSLPYNAHTTASDALWAGLPLVTCRGTAFAGRVAASLLHAVGLPHLVADDMAHFEVLSVGLARDPDLLQRVRRSLQDSRAAAPLFDTGRQCRNIEKAYRTMWEMCQRGAAPRGFSV